MEEERVEWAEDRRTIRMIQISPREVLNQAHRQLQARLRTGARPRASLLQLLSAGQSEVLVSRPVPSSSCQWSMLTIRSNHWSASSCLLHRHQTRETEGTHRFDTPSGHRRHRHSSTGAAPQHIPRRAGSDLPGKAITVAAQLHIELETRVSRQRRVCQPKPNISGPAAEGVPCSAVASRAAAPI